MARRTLPQRLIPINFLLGGLAIVIGLYYPIVDQKLIRSLDRTEVEAQVSQIVQVESKYFTIKERFVSFSSDESVYGVPQLELPEIGSKSKFLYEAFLDGSNRKLMVRARLKDKYIQQKKMSPMVYEVSINHEAGNNETSQGQWVKFSGKGYGIL